MPQSILRDFDQLLELFEQFCRPLPLVFVHPVLRGVIVLNHCEESRKENVEVALFEIEFHVYPQ
jgi:hypothetical protein